MRAEGFVNYSIPRPHFIHITGLLVGHSYLYVMKAVLTLLSLFLLYSSLSQAQQAVNYEFRAAWVATVENIDWPVKRGLSTAEQQSSFIELLDMHQRNGMNAVIVQVRPAADAFYPSSLEPWSEFLTGKQGLPPQPYYDPLEFMITETHKRGMEFHAWLNPYRAVFNILRSSIAPNHITKQHPEWFLSYGDKKYFNPGLPEVRNHVVKVVQDLVSRYKIDGIHMDDYFYPYPIGGKDFPDQASYLQYGKGMSKDEWRRSNCDSIILLLHKTIQKTNARVKFGVSPFGVWRNKSRDAMGSDTKAGLTNYDDLYADILLWMQNGWIDYVAPQLYWERGHKLADYDVLLKWWNDHSYGRHIYIGHAYYRAGSNSAWKGTDEIPAQIRALREYHTTQGSIYYNSSSFRKNPNGWNDSLRLHYYRYPALPPAMTWIDNTTPLQPLVEKQGEQVFKVVYKGEEPIKAFGVFIALQSTQATPNFENCQLIQLITASKTALIDLSKLPEAKGKQVYVVSVDIDNNISPFTPIHREE